MKDGFPAGPIVAGGFLGFCLFLLPPGALARDWWKIQKSGTDASLRAVSVAPISYTRGQMPFPSPAVWVSGAKGTILRSIDGGETWKSASPPSTNALDFRGIIAFDEKTAYAMSSGEGAKSRIYKTTDGGVTWRLQFTGDRKEFFLDSIACTSETHCTALGDPIEGMFTLLRTNDGEHWNVLPTEFLPFALPQEGAFAASNSCLLLKSDEDFFFVTGGPKARVFHTVDSGKSWEVSEPPLAHGNASAGIFSIATDAVGTIFVVGGDYKAPERRLGVAALSTDNGKTWRLWSLAPRGFRSAIAARSSTVVVVGANGSELSDDGGKNWKMAGDFPLNAVALLYNYGWAVGPNGTIANLKPRIELE